jgi:hypothetical protein
MYVSVKMTPAETIPGMGEEGIKKKGGGVNSSMIYLTHCKNFCKCHNIPPPSPTKTTTNMEYFSALKKN